MPDDILELRDVKTHFPVYSGFVFKRPAGAVRAVNGVTLNLGRGEVLGLVGESGCGKSTLARTILQLVPTTGGAVVLSGKNLTSATAEEIKAARRDLQMVFQDPYASLNPRMNVFAALAEPLRVHRVCPRQEVPARVAELMKQVGLDPRFMQKYPHEFSGGQRQRIAIARALALQPKVIVADEPVSALDVSTRAQIMNLLRELQRRSGLTMLFISHDLSIVAHMCREVAVMYLGQVVERAPRESLFRTPLHPYTAALLSAIPLPDPVLERTRTRIVLKGETPDPSAIPSGCRFHTRCLRATEVCVNLVPETRALLPGHTVACHHPLDA